MRNIWGHKWAVGIAALVLVLALGAVAWAATDDSTTTSEQDSGEVPALGGFMFGGDHGGFMGRGHGKGMMDFENMPEEFQQRMEERRQQMEERQQAFLDLIRDKMSDEDEQKLNELLDEAEAKRDVLDEAREDLQSTTSELRDLIGKYFPLGDRDEGEDSGSTTTTLTGTTTQ